MDPLLWLVKPLPSYYFLFVVAPANTQRPLSCCIFAEFFSPNYLLMCIVNTIIWICVPTGMSKFHIVKKTAVDSCVVFCRSKVNFMELNWEWKVYSWENHILFLFEVILDILDYEVQIWKVPLLSPGVLCSLQAKRSTHTSSSAS